MLYVMVLLEEHEPPHSELFTFHVVPGGVYQYEGDSYQRILQAIARHENLMEDISGAVDRLFENISEISRENSCEILSKNASRNYSLHVRGRRERARTAQQQV